MNQVLFGDVLIDTDGLDLAKMADTMLVPEDVALLFKSGSSTSIDGKAADAFRKWARRLPPAGSNVDLMSRNACMSCGRYERCEHRWKPT